MNDNDDLWAEVARLQALADSSRLSDQAWALDAAIDAILDRIASGVPTTPKQADNLVANRRRKLRHRRNIATGLPLFFATTVDDAALTESRSELSRIVKLVKPGEWALLVQVGLGDSCREIAKVKKLPLGTIKTRLTRARAKIVA